MTDTNIQKKILQWFRTSKRPLPWRKHRNWYTTWISEVMLQQTQVEQVIPYYNRFIKSFNDVNQLAGASEQQILKIWEGLGYYSRALNILKSARILVNQYNGNLPANRDQVIRLPGFGTYITNAVLSIAYNLPLGVVDGNVKRVITRLFLINDDIRKSKTNQKLQSVMDELLPKEKAGEFNEAMMELGAVICLPKNPLCSKCPISFRCQAFANNMVEILPVKSPRSRVPVVHSVAIIINFNNTYLIARRPAGAMLAGLWEFPIIKSDDHQATVTINKRILKKKFNIEAVQKKKWKPIKHMYTHYHLRLSSVLFITQSPFCEYDFYAEYKWCTLEEIKKLPLHKAMWKILVQIEDDLKIITQ